LLALMNRTRLLVAGLAIVVLILGTLIYRDVFVTTKSTGNTLNLYTIARRTVTASVTSSGNLVPDTQSNVNFKVSGTLTDIYVTVGDHVSAGQKLAQIDSAPEQTALLQAQANLAVAAANLQSAEKPLTAEQVAQLQDAVTTAQQAYNDTVAEVNLTNSSDSALVSADQAQVDADQQALTFNATYQQDLQTESTDKAALDAAIAVFDADGCKTQTYPYSGVCVTDYAAVATAQSNYGAAKTAVDTFPGVSQLQTDQSKLALDTAKQKTDSTSGKHSINQAAASLTSARDQLKTQTETKPNQVASARAQYDTALASVASAEESLRDTTLYAPLDGDVDAINGVAGETVSPGGGTTAEAPGGQAPLPGAAGSNAFMTIANVSGMEVVVPFAESDAARVAFGQEATLTFDAVPNLTISGKVIAVASSATISSGVVNYYATITLNTGNKALKQGMTANASVTVSRAENALTVPNLAVSHQGTQAFVLVYADGKQTQTPVETGVVGDQFTEVTGGVNEGEVIVIPTVRVSTSGSGTTGGGFRGGGFGGGRIGAGG
jgi:HlyD family secretion protein